MWRPRFNVAAETYLGRIRTSFNMRFPVMDGIIGIRGVHLVSEKGSGFRGLNFADDCCDDEEHSNKRQLTSALR
jgi:hypothetical protein